MKMRSLFLFFLMLMIPGFLSAQKRFVFRDGKFKVAQFTDLHWTPNSVKCADTEATIRAVLAQEQPDIAVLSGDVVTGDPAMEGWQRVVHIFEDAKIPFVVTMGNHDGEHLSRNEIYDYLIKSPLYAGTKGAKEIQGSGNCVLPVYGAQSNSNVAALLYCMDSNDYQPNKLYGAYDWIHFNQIDWYRRQSGRLTRLNKGSHIPALAFFHIPLIEYNDVRGDGKTFGNDLEGGVASAKINPGLFASFIDMKDVMGVFVGHDHDNDFIGINKGIALAYGRVTGADAYGELKRGARIIEMYEGKFKFDTWIATPAGREPTYYYPSGLNSLEEQNLTYSPAVEASSLRAGVAYSYYEGKCKRIADISLCKKMDEGVMANFSIKQAPSKDYFAYEYRALVNIVDKGVYRFYTFSDDGSMLYIDGQLVVDNDGGHSARRAEGKIALEKGLHEVRLLYFENYMGEELEVGYSGKHIEESIIPDNMLFLPD